MFSTIENKKDDTLILYAERLNQLRKHFHFRFGYFEKLLQEGSIEISEYQTLPQTIRNLKEKTLDLCDTNKKIFLELLEDSPLIPEKLEAFRSQWETDSNKLTEALQCSESRYETLKLKYQPALEQKYLIDYYKKNFIAYGEQFKIKIFQHWSRQCQQSKAFFEAFKEKDFDKADFYLKAGGNINTRDSKGYTPLALALEKGNVALVQWVLTRRANPNQKISLGPYKKMNYLTFVVLCHPKNTDKINLLLAYGAKINTPDDYQSTPLHWAVLTHSVYNCKVLLENKADIHIRNAEGLSPVDLLKKLRKCRTNKIIEKLFIPFRKGSFHSELLKKSEQNQSIKFPISPKRGISM